MIFNYLVDKLPL